MLLYSLVPDPPAIIQPPINTTTSIGITIQFTCSAIGQPAPNIYWTAHRHGVSETIYSNFSIRYISENETVSTLTLFRVTPAIAGEYTCIASNIIGTDTISAQLLVYSKLLKYNFCKGGSSANDRKGYKYI